MQLYEKNICQFTIFKLYTIYNKHELIKIGNQTRKREKSQVLSQVLEFLQTVRIKINAKYFVIFRILNLIILDIF